MTAPFIELYTDQWANFNHIITLSDDVTNEPLDITDFEITSQMRRSHYSENVSANISCTIINPSDGEITLTLSSEVTGNLRPGRYVFDVIMKDTSNVSSKILEGIVTVAPSVTHE